MFQDASLTTALTNPDFFGLSSKGLLLTQYVGVTKAAALPNYFALIGGDTLGGISDTPPEALSQTTLTDLLDNVAVSWKVYLEDYPGGCVLDQTIGNYTRRHNPFVSFTRLTASPQACARLAPLSAYAADERANTLPQFGLIIPNTVNGSLAGASALLTSSVWRLFDPSNRNTAYLEKALTVVTFDRADAAGDALFTLLIDHNNPSLAGQRDSTAYNHYSLLRSIELNFGAGNLGRNDVLSPTVPITYLAGDMSSGSSTSSGSGSVTGHIAGDLAILFFVLTWFLLWICNRDRSTWRLGVTGPCIGGECKNCLTYPIEMWEKRNCCACTERHFRTVRAQLTAMGLRKEAASLQEQQRGGGGGGASDDADNADDVDALPSHNDLEQANQENQYGDDEMDNATANPYGSEADVDERKS